MANLLKEFFRRDLNPTEWEALGRQLEGSRRDSLRFAKLAKKFYLNLGLPNPEGPTGPSASTVGAVIKIAVLGALIGAVAFVTVKIVHLLLTAPATPTPIRTPLLPKHSRPVLPVTAPHKIQVKPTATPTPLPPPKAAAPRPAKPAQVPPAPIPTPKPVQIFRPAVVPVQKPPPAPTATPEGSPTDLFGNGYKGQDVHQ
jgi:hypothetical protein